MTERGPFSAIMDPFFVADIIRPFDTCPHSVLREESMIAHTECLLFNQSSKLSGSNSFLLHCAVFQKGARLVSNSLVSGLHVHLHHVSESV